MKFDTSLSGGLDKLLRRLSDADKIGGAVAQDLKVKSNNLVPMRSGRLRRSASVRGTTVEYTAGYSAYVWRMRGVKWTTPGTKGRWAEDYIKRKGYEQVVLKYLK